MTGTAVLAIPHGDVLTALTQAVQLGTAALGLLVRYLTCPPPPGIGREELAASYNLSVGELRQGNRQLAEAGYLMQARRPSGKSWQHLIVVTDTPGRLPADHEAWVLLDAALAAEQATTSPEGAHVATSGNAAEDQVATSPEKSHIEPVNPFPAHDEDHKPSVVATVAELRRLAQLPPLPAPKEQGDMWLTPGQVLALATRYPPRYGDMALGVLSRENLPFYLAPRVMALLMQGYDTRQLARTLQGVGEGDHPAALARWRLDQLLLAPEPDHVPWRAPSTVLDGPPAPADLTTRSGSGAAACRAIALRVRAEGKHR
ncbi:hypothetical protein [Microtetraspora niveoalba]|uniref:hypothetical protein n=1 Tax=Microtetraspora niveoalba TaxID=46175 RepID=UPI00083256E1|nr:hypothetical protein [Microtetraspora niveoalba]